jgi:hypothetical protein
MNSAYMRFHIVVKAGQNARIPQEVVLEIEQTTVGSHSIKYVDHTPTLSVSLYACPFNHVWLCLVGYLTSTTYDTTENPYDMTENPQPWNLSWP